MRLTTAHERRQLDESRILLEELGYPTASKAVNDMLAYDSEQRAAVDGDEVDGLPRTAEGDMGQVLEHLQDEEDEG